MTLVMDPQQVFLPGSFHAAHSYSSRTVTTPGRVIIHGKGTQWFCYVYVNCTCYIIAWLGRSLDDEGVHHAMPRLVA